MSWRCAQRNDQPHSPAADALESAQAKYEDVDGFRSVVFDGGRVNVVVASEAVGSWRDRIVEDDVLLALSCVSTALLDDTKGAVNGLAVDPKEFWSVAYDALTDSMTVISTGPLPDLANSIESRGAADAQAALAAETLRLIPASAGDFADASRGADGEPFWGGARILSDVGGCTTGFYLNSASFGTTMLTAGHCFNGNGDVTWNGNSSFAVGTSEGRSYPDPDLALLDGETYAPRSYSAKNQTSSKAISASGNPPTGVVYCQMGATSLLICSAYSSLDADALGAHQLAYTSGPSGPSGSLGSGGDSGGGVYRELTDGTLSARGMVKATGCNVTTCARWDHKRQTILTFYDATVVLD